MVGTPRSTRSPEQHQAGASQRGHLGGSGERRRHSALCQQHIGVPTAAALWTQDSGVPGE